MLRKFLAILLLTIVTIGLLLPDAQARRFGGGRSFGISRSTSSFSRPASNYNQQFSNSSSAFGRSSSMGRWFGPLAGLLTGGLLASLFMGHGLGSGILSWLLIGGLFLVVLTFLKNRNQHSSRMHQTDDKNQFARDAAAQFMRNNAYQQPSAPSSSFSAAVNNYPIGFDAPTFLREAKLQFIRLQAAYDEKNLSDIREFTTPQVFAEIQLQIQERGNEENKTTVMSLEAELLQVENDSQLISGTEMQTLLASVRFTGLIQENKNEAAIHINEVWHFKKEVANLRWQVAGVQQN